MNGPLRTLVFLFAALGACAATHAEGLSVYPTTDSTVSQTDYQLPILSISGDATSEQSVVSYGTDPSSSVLTLPESYPLAEELPAGCDDIDDAVPYRGVTPYGGGHIYDWAWGCGGSPYRTGPGCCDDWYVGPVWDVGVDGMTLFREDADLTAIEAAAANPQPPEYSNQFDWGGGARVLLTGTLPRGTGYQLQFGYEGVQDWNAAIVYPEVVVVAPIEQRRSIHYNSSLNSAEFNVVPTRYSSVWRPYVGVRYVRFADEIRDKSDQYLPVPPMAGDELVDDRSIFDIKNNLIGFQTGLRLDLWKLSRRLSLEGFINAGVYYNAVQRRDSEVTKTTSYSLDMDMNLVSSDFTTATEVDSDPSEVAYLAEASLSGVCRVNKCLAVRGGYQVLWIDGLHLASDSYLNSTISERGLWFDGWHIGAEYRR